MPSSRENIVTNSAVPRAIVVAIGALAMVGGAVIAATHEAAFLLIPSAVLVVLPFLYDWLRSRETVEARKNSWSMSRIANIDQTDPQRRKANRGMSILGTIVSLGIVLFGIFFPGEDALGYVVIWGGSFWLSLAVSALLYSRRAN